MPEPANTTTIETVHQLTGTFNLVVSSVSRKLQGSRNERPLPERGGMLGETCGFLLLSEAVNIDSAVFCCSRSEGGVGCSGSLMGEEYFSQGGQGTPLWSSRGGAERAVWPSTEMLAGTEGRRREQRTFLTAGGRGFLFLQPTSRGQYWGRFSLISHPSVLI